MSVESVEACEVVQVVLCSNLPRSQVIHNTLVLLVLLVRAVPSTQPVLQDTAALRRSSLRLRSAGGQAKKPPLNGLVQRKIYRKPQVFPWNILKYRLSMGFLWFVPCANPLNESAFHDQLHHQDWWDAENCAENFTRLKTRRGIRLHRLGDSESLLWATFAVEKSPPDCSGNRISMDFPST